MKKIILIALTTISALSSCSKRDKTIAPEPALQHYEGGQPQHKDGGDDDDPVIIIEKSVTLTGNGYIPVGGAAVVLTNANHVIEAETDEHGECKVYLPYLALWHFSLTRQGYMPISVDINVQDSSINRTDTLQPQQ